MSPWWIVLVLVVALLAIVVRLNLVTRQGRDEWRRVMRGSTLHKVFVVAVGVAALAAGLLIGWLQRHH